MITGFVALAGTLLSILFWELKRHATREDDPKQQNLERYQKIDRDLVKRDSLAATVGASDDLDLLDRLQNASARH